MGAKYRSNILSHAFAASVVREATHEIIVPVPLNEEELQHYQGFYAYRRAAEWRHGELLVLAELSRLSVKIEQLSRQLSLENFENVKLLNQYERVCKIRNGLRQQVNLTISAMAAKTMAGQKIAANQLLEGLNAPANTTVLSTRPESKIDWKEALE